MLLRVRTRLILNVFRAQVESIAVKAGRGDLVPALLAGYGGVIETGLADDVWSLGHQRITLDEFLSRHGFHGPNEGNVIGHSWRGEPGPGPPAAAAPRGRARADRPAARAERAAAMRRNAEADLLSTLPVARRLLVRRLLASTGAQVRAVELTKAAFLTAVDGCRAAAGGFGAELVDAGTLDRVDDACYLTVDELLAPLPANVRELVEFRRTRREEYRRLEVPSVFTGMPETIEGSNEPPSEAAVIRETPAGPGVFEGTVRVVVDAESKDTLDDGEVLVCKFVDPGWTALVSLAGGLVTDMGSPASHGAVVARGG